MRTEHLLIELGTEELPPKPLKKFAEHFAATIEQGLKQAELSYSELRSYAAPRRLALSIRDLAAKQADRQVEKRGPALAAAFDAEGNPTKACEGFLRGAKAEASQLFKRDNYVWLLSDEKGKTVQELIPELVAQALQTLPIPKRMRWGNSQAEFVRPVHWLVLLYGKEVIPARILEKEADRYTYGHRFHHPAALCLEQAEDYEKTLEQAFVLPCFEKRREKIRQQIQALAQEKKGQALINEALLDEVTALTEWPVALCGLFKESFLQVPAEALISSMENHQKSFALADNKHALLPYFITIANIASRDQARVIAGNERVIHARLADAEFFYKTDLKTPFAEYNEPLKKVVFQAKLGTVHDKVLRLQKLAAYLSKTFNTNSASALRTAQLCKADLMTAMVGEFPELQGIAGSYYATEAGEKAEVALAIKEHYLPRFAGDELPTTEAGCIVAIADRIDTLVGIFGINQTPSGEKDPFALRRAAMGILRILIEQNLSLDLAALIHLAAANFEQRPNAEVETQVFAFIMERLRAWYTDRGLNADLFNAVAAVNPNNPLDFHQRINAVNHFSTLPEAASLAAANKRVSRLLQKENITAELSFNPTLLQDEAEKALANSLEKLKPQIETSFAEGKYQQVLTLLATLREAIDCFFEQVMVMVEDTKVKNNRLALLQQLRKCFLLVADISLLQG